MENYNSLLQQFESLELGELTSVRLMSRQDTKFIFHASLLPDVLERLQARFRIMQIDGDRSFRYDTRYLDRPELDLYLQHHNGHRPRFKLRYRKYPVPEAVYFEVKIKDNRDRTSKYRLPVVAMREQPTKDEITMAEKYTEIPLKGFTRVLDVSYRRITLINRDEPDRITIDLGIRARYKDDWSSFGDLVIAEIKQPRYRQNSLFFRSMRDLRIPEMRLSKYCLGILQTHGDVRYNRFKPKLLWLDKLLNTRKFTESLYA